MGQLLLPGHSFSSRHLHFSASFLHVLEAEGLSQRYEKGYAILQMDPIFSSLLVQQVGNSASVFKLISLILRFSGHSKKIQLVMNLCICFVMMFDTFYSP